MSDGVMIEGSEPEDPVERFVMHLEPGFDEEWVRTGPPRRLLSRAHPGAVFVAGDVDRDRTTCALAFLLPSDEGAQLVVVGMLPVGDEPHDWRLVSIDPTDYPTGLVDDLRRDPNGSAPHCRPVISLLVEGRTRVDVLATDAGVASAELDGRELSASPDGVLLAAGPSDAVLRLLRADGSEAWAGTLDDVDLLTLGETWDDWDRAQTGEGHVATR